jgi:hypothetical protein
MPNKTVQRREPADWLRDKSNVMGGWLPSLTFAFSTPLRSVENAAVERELLPSSPLRENQEFETDALWGTAQLPH